MILENSLTIKGAQKNEHRALLSLEGQADTVTYSEDEGDPEPLGKSADHSGAKLDTSRWWQQALILVGEESELGMGPVRRGLQPNRPPGISCLSPLEPYSQTLWGSKSEAVMVPLETEIMEILKEQF